MKKDVKNITTIEHQDHAEIFLYGYIGDHWDESKANSDIAFVNTLSKLEAKYDKIHVRINGPGGSVYHGNAITNAIQNSKKEIHTFIDGLAASMSFMIWMSAKHRHASKSAVAMCHKPIAAVYGNADDMQEMASILSKFEDGLVNTMVESTGLQEEDVRSTYFSIKDKWMSRKDMVESGLITSTEEYESENNLPEDIGNMTYDQVINIFESQKGEGESVSLLQSLKAKAQQTQKLITSAAAALFHHKPSKEMNIEEFKASLANGDLKIEEVKAALEAQAPTPEPTPAPAAPAASADPVPAEPVESNGDITEAIKAAISPLHDEIKSLKAELEDVKKLPGATASNPPIPSDKLQDGVTDPKAQAELDEANKVFEEHPLGGFSH